MYKIDPETGKQKFYAKDGTKSVISAVISILIGMIVGTLIIIIVGLTKEGISINGIWEGIKLVFFEDIYKLPENILCAKGRIEAICLQNGKLTRGELFETIFINKVEKKQDS